MLLDLSKRHRYTDKKREIGPGNDQTEKKERSFQCDAIHIRDFCTTLKVKPLNSPLPMTTCLVDRKHFLVHYFSILYVAHSKKKEGNHHPPTLLSSIAARYNKRNLNEDYLSCNRLFFSFHILIFYNN